MMPSRGVPRGAIRHPETYRQMFDFSGLQFERKITPMDIDFCLEFSGRQLVLGEFKGPGGKIRRGQRKALTTLAIAAHRGGMDVLAFIARHDSAPDEVVKAHLAQVVEVLSPDFHPFWRKPSGGDRRVRELIDSWRVWRQHDYGLLQKFE